MKTKTQVKNQGEQLKVKRTNYLTPPYTKPSKEKMSRWEQSKQLTILPPLQPTPKQLLQHQQVEKSKQKVRTKATPKSKPTPNKSSQQKRDIQKEKKEMLEWLNSVQIR